jgi:hypothetical protein
MKRRNFLQLMAALAGVPFLPKAATAAAEVVDPGHYHSIPPQIGPPPIPVGQISAYAGAKMPPGWLPCDGRAVFKSDYPELFKTIGYSYPNAFETNSSPHSFNLPFAAPCFARHRSGPVYSEFKDRVEISLEDSFVGTYYIIKAK